MESYKCTRCGTNSPIKGVDGKVLDKDRPCFRCGNRERVRVTLPNFAPTKKGRRSRFRGHRIIRIGT
jgi:DNA-directed RNA polymerase subunit RPC12/RpoP